MGNKRLVLHRSKKLPRCTRVGTMPEERENNEMDAHLHGGEIKICSQRGSGLWRNGNDDVLVWISELSEELVCTLLF